ncbi:dipeptidase [Sphingomonas sp. RB56-2]|uniref:Dipeptidase n=1 Tax=Sphingomonas brevis TaxID=2908206 RepID=A0ABT0SCG9_9SPHN|nr:dipeptidase [Sphingomonas brevis]MCL6742105.1 dipeptidase [Sphingomonas brevis]
MRKLGWALAIVVILVAAAALMLPGYIERGQNQIDGNRLIPVSPQAKQLHASLTIVDLHADTLLWKRSLLDGSDRGHIDLPRLQQGNVALQVFSSVTKSPKGLNYDRNSADAADDITLLSIAQAQPVRTWNSLLQRSLWQAQKLDRAVAASNGQLRSVGNDADLDALLADRVRAKPIAAMLSIEGLHDLEGKAENLDKLYAAGFRMAGLTHFFDNQLAGSMHGEKKGGLTPFGRRIVRAMEAKGMIVDIAHCSHKCVADILGMARRPVVSSHGGVQATCKVNRNLTDEEIRGVARTGGVIGIGYWDAAVCDISPRSIAKAMRYVRDLVGVSYVALGSDFDGSTTTRFDVAHLDQVTQALLDEGFTPDEIRAVMGGNALRVLRAGLVPMPAPVPLAAR